MNNVMKCIIFSFVGCILLLSHHCVSSQPHHALNDVPRSANLFKESYSTINSARRTYKKETNNEIEQTLPWGYTEFSGCDMEFKTAYKFHPIKKSWVEAAQLCYLEGGYLAYPDCAKENRIYHDILKFLKSGGAWLGMSDRAKEGDWVTVMHQERVDDLPYVNWALTEPNNYGPDGEDCAELYLDGSWYDTSCDKKLFFICKIDLE